MGSASSGTLENPLHSFLTQAGVVLLFNPQTGWSGLRLTLQPWVNALVTVATPGRSLEQLQAIWRVFSQEFRKCVVKSRLQPMRGRLLLVPDPKKSAGASPALSDQGLLEMFLLSPQ